MGLLKPKEEKKPTELNAFELENTLYKSLNRRMQLGKVVIPDEIIELKNLELKIIRAYFVLGIKERDKDKRKDRYEKTINECKNYNENAKKYPIYQNDAKALQEVDHIYEGVKTKLNLLLRNLHNH